MSTYDWIVIGNGMTGAALSYELAKVGLSVLLLEKSPQPDNATRHSYGGVAYWAGTTELTQHLCQVGIERHRVLPDELEAPTEFQELDLLLPVRHGDSVENQLEVYSSCGIPPRGLSVAEACELEPELNRDAIVGALTVRHGHVNTVALVQAYNQGFIREGGTQQVDQVTELLRTGQRITGVKTLTATYTGANVAVCAGGHSRTLLRNAEIACPIYTSRAELIQVPLSEIQLHTLVMPAALQRFEFEARASRSATDSLWDELGHEITAPILDVGAVQFLDGSLRLGQMSRALTSLDATPAGAASETALRRAIGEILPALQDLPGTWHCCPVTFTRDSLPLVGPVPGIEGLHVFSGFSNPLALLPGTAVYFAQRVAQQSSPQVDEFIIQMLPNRFAKTTE